MNNQNRQPEIDPHIVECIAALILDGEDWERVFQAAPQDKYKRLQDTGADLSGLSVEHEAFIRMLQEGNSNTYETVGVLESETHD